jgi:hypothetical protein
VYIQYGNLVLEGMNQHNAISAGQATTWLLAGPRHELQKLKLQQQDRSV